MPIIVEDGTNIADANSYSDADFVRQYALARGIELTDEDEELMPMMIKAMDYIEAKRSQFKGLKTFVDQPLQFPRTGVTIDNIAIPTDGAGSIPVVLKQAQAQLVMELWNKGAEEEKDVMPNLEGYAVRRKKVDVLDTEYATGGGSMGGLAFPVLPTFTKVDALLNPLIARSGFVSVVRV